MRQVRSRLTILALSVSIAATAAGDRRRGVRSQSGAFFCDSGDDIAGVQVPPGFCIRKFADVPTPRILAFTPGGDVLVSSPEAITYGGAPAGAAAIFLFREQSGEPPVRYTFAQGPAFSTVHGLLITGGRLYYTVEDSLYSVAYSPGQTRIGADPPQRIADLSRTEPYARWPHTVTQSNDGSILVSMGQADNNQCPPADPRIGAVLRVGENRALRGETVTTGLRNPVFIRCMPWSTCYAAELSGDVWEDKGGSEKLIEIHDGETLGYPCCIDRNLPNLDIQPTPDCARVLQSKQTFPLHDTPFGFDWERNGSWPAPYRGSFFIALHGKFQTWQHAGLYWSPSDPATHAPSAPIAPFVTGLGRNRPIARAADVVFAPDGRLFFTDDQGGAIYWIAPRSLKR